MYSMMNEIKELLTEGGTKVFTKYAVEIGDALWCALYNYIANTHAEYAIDGVFEENGQKFAVLCNRPEMKYYRLNFSLSETEGFKAEGALEEVTKSYTSVAGTQFSVAEVEAYIAEYAKKKEEEDKNKGKTDEEDKKDSENNSEDGEKSDKKDDDKEEDNKKDNATNEDSEKKDEEDKKKKAKKFSFDSLEEIPEYVELKTNFSTLETQVAELNSTIESLNAELTTLRDFKAQAERSDKEAKIAEFYMLSDEDKKDVVENIDKYSLEDIESKLSVICFRNKVSFKTDEDSSNS